MSDNLVRNVRGKRTRQQLRMLPQEVLEWKAKSLQALGWASKTAGQDIMSDAMDETCVRIQSSTMRGAGEFGAVATQGLRKDAGKEFKAYHDQRTAFEAALPRTSAMVVNLKAAAQAYVDHFNAHDKKRKADPKNIAKRDACEGTIKELYKFDLADQVKALGPPPWDSAQSMQAASLKTALAIDSLPPGEQRAENLGGAHESPAFWINQRGDPGKVDKTFIFKPAGKCFQPGFPHGGEPAREAMGGRVADMLNGALGLTLPVPETQVISVGKESMPKESLDKLIKEKTLQDSAAYVGSVQQFEATQGEMRGMTLADRANIPTRATQELAIFDTITLNTDRHEGNFLVKGGATPSLVPIDHGLSFPTRGSGSEITRNIGGAHNALMSLPGSHQPFTAEMQLALAKLDPDALAEAMKRERDVMEEAHPSTAGTMADESIELSRRSAMFLKAAGPRLTPAAVQVGIGRFNKELFAADLDMTGFDALADKIITELEGQQAAIGEYFQMPPQMMRKMKTDLAAKGWDVGSFASGNSVLNNPAVALRMWKSGMQAPDKERDPLRRPIDIDENTQKEIAAAQLAFPKLKAPAGVDAKRAVVEDWRDWTDLGGTPDKIREAVGLLGLQDDNITEAYENIGKAVEYLKQAAGFKTALANDNTDDGLVDIRNAIAYIDDIAPALSPNTRFGTLQTLLPIRTALNGPVTMDANAKQQAMVTLAPMRGPLTDEARTRLLQKFDTLILAAADENEKAELQQDQFEARAYGISGGYEAVRKRDANLADAP